MTDNPSADRRSRKSSEKAARVMGSSGRSIEKAKTVQRYAPHLGDLVQAGEMSLSAAYEEARRIALQARAAGNDLGPRSRVGGCGTPAGPVPSYVDVPPDGASVSSLPAGVRRRVYDVINTSGDFSGCPSEMTERILAALSGEQPEPIDIRGGFYPNMTGGRCACCHIAVGRGDDAHPCEAPNAPCDCECRNDEDAAPDNTR